jgi:hypothetical protein
MASQESIDRKNAPNGALPALTPWTFVRAAVVANLVVATLVFIEFSAIALVNHNGNAFQLGLSLIPLVTLVIWGTVTVIYVVHLTSWGLGRLGRLNGPARSSPAVRSGVWDNWLDEPEPRHP